MDTNAIIALIPALAPYAGAITSAVTICAAVATVMPPPPKPTGVYAAIYKAVNFIAWNVGHAKNATEASK